MRCTEDLINLPSPGSIMLGIFWSHEGPVVLRLRALRSQVKDDEFNLRWNEILRFVCILGDSSQSSPDTFDRHDEESRRKTPPMDPAMQLVTMDMARKQNPYLCFVLKLRLQQLMPFSSDTRRSTLAPTSGHTVAPSTEVTIYRLFVGSLTAGPSPSVNRHG